MCEAIEKGNIKSVKTIIKKGIDVDLPVKKDEFPLFYTAGYGRPKIARLLIQAGANVNIKDSNGDTTLHIAIRECGASSGNCCYLIKYVQQAIISKQVKHNFVARNMSNEV